MDDQATIDQAKYLAREFAKENSNDQGYLYAKLWETPEFRESFDYGMGYEKKNMLRYRCETIFRHTRMSKQLFQKIYYYPNLLLEDEVNLRKKFISESASHDLRSTLINWVVAGSYLPTLWAASTRLRGWPCVFVVSTAWIIFYRQAHNYNKNMLQNNLNSFASPLIEKYQITDHHDS